ncbi:MAG: asparaginase [Epulopiscium sp.]|nr:asparaginase [Candidatus Epulonipiscium sp.]
MKKVGVIFTGGTISMVVDEKLKAVIPGLSDAEIMEKVIGIEKIAKVESFHFGAYPGPHVTPQIMIEIGRQAKQLLAREDIEGVVITHGTDSLEETAYLLDLTISSVKPVVVTGAMRSSSELGFDGPANLAASICTVLSPESRDKGVLVVMNNQVNAATEVAKSHTLNLDTFQSMEFGPLGIVDQDQVIYYRDIKKRQYIETDHIVDEVALVKTVAGMDSTLLKYCVDTGCKGIVIEGMGRGNLPPQMLEGVGYAIDHNIPVVLVSRCPMGRVLDTYGYEGAGRELREMGVILGDSLSGQKARIKLMLILSITSDQKEIKRLFEKNLYQTV